MSRVMLDASALLAFLNGEPGGDTVPAMTGDAVISSVNFAEIVSVLTAQGMDEALVRKQLGLLVLDVRDFGRQAAEEAGFMIAQTRSSGLSLGDRACLAAARHERIPALTADRSWSKIDVGVEIQFIR